MGTDKGDILVVENGDVRGNLTLDPAGPCAIAAIVATPKVDFTSSAFTQAMQVKLRYHHHCPSLVLSCYSIGPLYVYRCY